jgi:hypothetical protein
MLIRYINTICAVVGAISALAIPLVLSHNTEIIRKNDETIAAKARTLEFMQKLDEDIASILAQKTLLDRANGVEGERAFSSAYIDDVAHRDVQTQVYRLLNLYEFACIATEDRLFSQDVVEDLRGDALRETWQDYHEYVVAHRGRQSQNSRAWIGCDTLIGKMKT